MQLLPGFSIFLHCDFTVKVDGDTLSISMFTGKPFFFGLAFLILIVLGLLVFPTITVCPNASDEGTILTAAAVAVEVGVAVAVPPVAVAMAEGPAAGLALVEELEATGALASYHLLAATKADLLRRLGRMGEATAEYRRAIEGAANDAERLYLNRRLAETAGGVSA